MESKSTDRSPAGESIDLPARLAFLGMTEEDRQRLRQMRPNLDAGGKEFVEAFYHHLFAFEETARFLRDPDLVERLKVAQLSHLQSMLEANWDDVYVARRRRVGDTHAQAGIHPQIFLGAYNQYLQYGLRRIAESGPATMQPELEQILSLLKAVFLDIELTLDVYFAQATLNLRSALDMVFKANADLRHFAQLTSHDLKTPLATVANLCDEALDEFGEHMPGEARKLIEAARNRTFRMSTTIDELLNATMSLEGSSSQAVSTAEIVAAALEPLQATLPARNIKVKVAPNLPAVMGDPIRLREAFYNVLSNAAKFIDKDPGRIVVDFEETDTECIFSIADNGPGIPPEELPRVFVPFRRLPAHQHVPGSGLGLYFTKTLIEQQGGRVWAESELGQGSRFCIALPRRVKPSPARPATS